MSEVGVTHGALDHAELAALGFAPGDVLDFSSNLNPFGPPAAVRAALAALDPAPYPDRSCYALRRVLAEHHGCALDCILVGNGSNELIHLAARALLRAGDTALIVAPTFGEYERAVTLCGGHVLVWRAKVDFEIDITELVATITRLRPRLVWLCAPNNPTGVAPTPAELIALAEMCARVGTTLLLDCAYAAFVRASNGHQDIIDTLALPNTLRLYSLTKTYALAGLRLGYMLGAPDVIAQIARYQPTWSVSSAAQAAGLAALNDAAFIAETLPRLWRSSDELRAGLCALGLPVWRAALPFMLVRTGDGAATRAALLRAGIMVRDCASFGLPQWVRVAPQRPEANARLLAAFEKV